jgi:hypothetical protein
MMLKKMLIAAAVGGLVAGVALPVQAARHAAAPVQAGKHAAAGPMTCKEAAKLKFPSDLRARHAYKHECKTAWKASHKKAA